MENNIENHIEEQIEDHIEEQIEDHIEEQIEDHIEDNGHIIEEYFDAALALVKSAGAHISEYADGCQDYEEKSSDIDLVTEIDMKIEEMLIDGLTEKFPTHQFVGEESVAHSENGCELTDDPTWVIDPVDGTLNFVHGFPHSCISVGLLIKQEPVLGIIYNPLLNQLFTAQKGKGAYKNGIRINTSEVKELCNALVTFECGTTRDNEQCNVMCENYKRIVRKSQGVRSLGSAALNMAMVAMGAADANFEIGIHAWDTAAGYVLVKEAGGVVIDPAGGPYDILSRRVLCAATPELAEELSNAVAQYYPERD